MAERFVVGDTVTLSNTFKVSGTATDPTTVSRRHRPGRDRHHVHLRRVDHHQERSRRLHQERHRIDRRPLVVPVDRHGNRR